jgi:hypothetical protein
VATDRAAMAGFVQRLKIGMKYFGSQAPTHCHHMVVTETVQSLHEIAQNYRLFCRKFHFITVNCILLYCLTLHIPCNTFQNHVILPLNWFMV